MVTNYTLHHNYDFLDNSKYFISSFLLVQLFWITVDRICKVFLYHMEDLCLLKMNFALLINFTSFLLKPEIFHGLIAEVFCCINLLFYISDFNYFGEKVRMEKGTWRWYPIRKAPVSKLVGKPSILAQRLRNTFVISSRQFADFYISKAISDSFRILSC